MKKEAGKYQIKRFNTPIVSVESQRRFSGNVSMRFQYSNCIGRISISLSVNSYSFSFNTPIVSVEYFFNQA